MSTSSYLECRTRHTPNSMRAKSVSNMMYSQKRKSIFFQCIYAYFYCYLQLATKVNRFSHRWMQKWRIICKRNYHDLERSSYGCCWRSSGPGTSWRENIYMYRLTKCYNIPDGSSTSPTWLELEEHLSLMTMTASSNTTLSASTSTKASKTTTSLLPSSMHCRITLSLPCAVLNEMYVTFPCILSLVSNKIRRCFKLCYELMIW